MDRDKRITDDDLARSHRATDPVGPNAQPEGKGSEGANPSADQFDRPIVGRSGESDEKSTGEG